jgi:hypothetical protein
VSILRRMTSHLDDTAFAELWTNALADGSTPAEHPHLRACAECRLRFTSFSNWMEDLRQDAIGEADEAISADSLAAQRAQIFRRLEAAERPARVIAFPKTPVDAMRSSPMRRWVAVAAAAGLILGVGLGQLLDLRHMSSFQTDRFVEAPARQTARGPEAIPAVATFNDDAAFPELEEPATPHYEALRAYETFTPRAADFVQPR